MHFLDDRNSGCHTACLSGHPFCIRKASTAGSAMEPTLYNGEEVFINTKAYLLFSPDREDVIAFYDREKALEGGE